VLSDMKGQEMRKIQPSYFVVMVTYSDGESEAIVNPTEGRQDIISNLTKGDVYRGQIAFIHHISDGFMVDDVTMELMGEAEGELKAEALNRADRLANTLDHNRKLRAEAV